MANKEQTFGCKVQVSRHARSTVTCIPMQTFKALFRLEITYLAFDLAYPQAHAYEFP